MVYVPPQVLLVFITYQRTEYALRTIEAVRSHLLCDNLWWYLADDGSSPEHVAAVKEALNGFKLLDGHSMRVSYGAGANRALRVAANHRINYLFFLEDDWELRADLDLTPYVQLLTDDKSVSMVRLGYLNPGITGTTFDYHGEIFWRLGRRPVAGQEEAMVFTAHPGLRHSRFHEAYGWYKEKLNPGDTELAMHYAFSTTNGPDVAWPARNGQNGPFAHIGKVQSYS